MFFKSCHILLKTWVGYIIEDQIHLTGTIHFLSVTSVGTVGSEFNSMTFSTSSPIGVHTLYKQVTMNACGKTKIYIKLTDLKVYDTYGNVISMYNFGPMKFIKSNYQ